MKKLKASFPYHFIRGSIGKKITVRHTPWGILVCKYPDMSNIKPSKAQRSCRNLFKEAVTWAQQVIADPARKKAWQKRLRRRNGVYNAAVKHYMLKEKNKMLYGVKEAEVIHVKMLLAGKRKHKKNVVKKINPSTLTGLIPGIKKVSSKLILSSPSRAKISCEVG